MYFFSSIFYCYFGLIIFLLYNQVVVSRNEKKYLGSVTKRIFDSIFNPNLTQSVHLKSEEGNIMKGYLIATEFADTSCKRENGTIALSLETCLSNMIATDSKELAFKLSVKLVADTYEVSYQGFSDKSCQKKQGTPKKRISNVDACYSKMKWNFVEKLDWTNKKKGVALASFKTIDACNKHDMEAIDAFVSAPYGSCRDNDDQADDKFTGCDSATIYGRSFTSSDHTCQGKASSWIVPRIECLDLAGSPFSYLCI